jgi:hypothetical protein
MTHRPLGRHVAGNQSTEGLPIGHRRTKCASGNGLAERLVPDDRYTALGLTTLAATSRCGCDTLWITEVSVHML